MNISKQGLLARCLGASVAFTCILSAGQTPSVSVFQDLSGNLTSIGPSAGTGPSIAIQPRSTVASVGQAVYWTVLAGGSLPLSYQWQLNSNNIAGATADSLSLLNVASTDFGSYRVIVSNAFGSVTSSNALLQLDSDHDG